jgi:hypothetical protein
MRPVDVLQVTDGQDRGARFGLPGPQATIGRGPMMDMVLTDPEVAARHALLRVDGERLTVNALGGGATVRVNGIARFGPVALAPGDRIDLGATELTVLWTPARGAAEAGEPETPRPPETGPEAPPHAGPARPRRVVAMPALMASAAVAAALLGFAATTMPALETHGDAVSLWTIEPQGLGALAVLVSLGTLVLAAAWLRVELSPERHAARGLLTMATAGAGGVVAGIALMVAATPGPATHAGEGLGAMAVAGLTLIALALARMRLLAGPRRGPAPPDAVDPRTLLVGVGGLGGLVAALAAPLAWTSDARGGSLSGFDATVAAGRWLVPLALAMSAACVVAAVVGRLVEQRTTAPACVVAIGLGALTCSFAVTAAVALSAAAAGTGLVLAVAGSALGATAVAAGALAIAADVRDPARVSGGSDPTPATVPDRLG